MYFILSKLLVIFIYPFIWVLFILLYAAFCRSPRRKQKLLFAGLMMLYFFGNTLFLKLFVRTWDVDTRPLPLETYSSIILLGGFVSEGDNGSGFFNQSADRYIQAVQLLAGHRAAHLLFTGGSASLNPGKFTEGAFVKASLRQLRFADTAILIDSRARNTIENATYSKRLLEQAGLKPPYVLVTSAFHMRRALLTFKNAGLNVVPYPSDRMIDTKTITLSDLTPDAENFMIWGRYIKEVIGYTVVLLKA